MATWSAALAAHLVPAGVLERRARERVAAEGQRGRLATGMAVLDGALGGGWPRGCVCEVAGPRSSGRTTLLYLSLAQALATGEAAALVDVGGGLDPRAAEALGIPLPRLLWVRSPAKQALAATDLVVNAGGFALVVLDFGDQSAHAPMAAWQKLKRATASQHTTLLLGAAHRPQGALGRLALRLHPGRPVFSGPLPWARLLIELQAEAQLERRCQELAETAPANTVGTLPLHWPRGPLPPQRSRSG